MTVHLTVSRNGFSETHNVSKTQFIVHELSNLLNAKPLRDHDQAVEMMIIDVWNHLLADD